MTVISPLDYSPSLSVISKCRNQFLAFHPMRDANFYTKPSPAFSAPAELNSKFLPCSLPPVCP